MKELFNFIFILICVFAFAVSCRVNTNVDHNYQVKLDSINLAFSMYRDSVEGDRDFYINTIDSMYNINNALTKDNYEINDSLRIVGEQAKVAEYKLLRIAEYNRIAAQRNNIKYLRGWIARVLRD